MSAAQCLVAIALSVSTSLIALTHSQITRTALLPVIILSAIQAMRNITHVCPETGVASVFCLFTTIWLFHIGNILLLERWTTRDSTFRRRLLASYKVLFDLRRVSSPATSRRQGKNSTQTRSASVSKAAFLRRQLALFATAAMLYAIYLLYLPEIVLRYLSPQLQLHLTCSASIAAFSRSELALRAFLVLDFIISTWIANHLFHPIFAILAVFICRLDDPTEWPPLWGAKITHTYTVANFWGRFWHRLAAEPYGAWSRAVLGYAGVDVSSGRGKSLVVGMVFLISGVAHAVTTVLLGVACGWKVDVLWFCGNYVGIVVERLVEGWIETTVGASVGNVQSMRRSRCKRLFGILWTWTFLLWSIPEMQYTKMFCGLKQG